MNAIIEKRQLLLGVSFCAFVFSIASFFTHFTVTWNERITTSEELKLSSVNHGINMFVHSAPEYHILFLFSLVLLTGLTLVSLFKSKRFFPTFIFTTSSICFFIYWLFSTPKEVALIEGSNNLQASDFILYKSNVYDFFVLTFVSILLFWQIVHLLRMLIKTLQRKNTLP